MNWESIEHLKAILLLLEKSVKKEGGERYHIISGEDYPLFPNNEIYKIFYNNNHRSYNGSEQRTSKKAMRIGDSAIIGRIQNSLGIIRINP